MNEGIVKEHSRKIKTYKGEWYTVNSLFGNEWAMFYCMLGGRETGKSYSAMNWGTNRKLKKGDRLKMYWFRLTEAAANNLLADSANKFIDPDLKKKYNINTFKKNHTIYTYTPVITVDKNGKEHKSKTNVKEFCEVLACSTFYNTKGVGYFDNTFDGEYYIVLDEMNREESEKNSFDIVYNFVNLLENIIRSTKVKIKILMIGNTLEETSDILAAFNFLPDDFGRYKLKSKRCIIDYIKPNENYMKRRKGTAADIIMGNASTFTNEVMVDRSLLVNKRKCTRPSTIIKFTKEKDTWFTLWNDNIIKPYNNEQRRAIAMRRYLDENYQQELVNIVREKFDARSYKFTNLACFKRFEKNLKLLKKS